MEFEAKYPEEQLVFEVLRRRRWEVGSGYATARWVSQRVEEEFNWRIPAKNMKAFLKRLLSRGLVSRGKTGWRVADRYAPEPRPKRVLRAKQNAQLMSPGRRRGDRWAWRNRPKPL